MVQILQRSPSFAEQLGLGLGSGFSQGVSKAGDFAMQMATEKAKLAQRKKLIDQIEGGTSNNPAPPPTLPPSPEELKNKFLDSLPEIERAMGRELMPEDLDNIWRELTAGQAQQSQMNQVQEDPFSKAKKYAAIGEHDLSRVASEEAKTAEKRRTAERAEAYALVKPSLERARELSEDLPYKQNALEAMRESTLSGNIGRFSLDALAEATGIEQLRSPEGAAFKTASKEFFLGNLSRVGSRGLNQMMERVILEMSPLIGRSEQANLSVMEILDAENAVSEKEANLIYDISRQYKEKHGAYPEDLAQRVNKELKPYAVERQKEALTRIEKINETFSPKTKEGVLMYDPRGNLRRVPHSDRKEALKEGYRMP